MKRKSLFLTALFFVFFYGCFVYSFYPLYTNDDLFANDLLVGEWIDSDSTIWKFDFNYHGERLSENRDSTSFVLQMKEKDSPDFPANEFLVHVIRLDGTYFLDFYLEEYFDEDNFTIFDLHLMPMHTFARLELEGDQAEIRWFTPDWLEEMLKQNPAAIRHENNGNHILITAKTEELQQFFIQYANSEDAFGEGVDAQLQRIGR
jgi:hypothetical protein